jgi:hypothetical protein
MRAREAFASVARPRGRRIYRACSVVSISARRS